MNSQNTPLLLNTIGRDESRIWLAFEVQCDHDESGQEVWSLEFEGCGIDPWSDHREARREVKVAAENVRREAENARLDELQAGKEPPAGSHYIRYARVEAHEYHERTWVDYMREEVGWADMLASGIDQNGWPIGDRHEEGPLDFLLRHGIAPGQPFLVRFFGFSAGRYDAYNGDYDGPDYACEIIAVGPPPANVLEEIERAWAYDVRSQHEIGQSIPHVRVQHHGGGLIDVKTLDILRVEPGDTQIDAR